MILRAIIVLIVFITLTKTVFPWGGSGHFFINLKAVQFLPAEMQEFKKWADYISEHAADPDKRRDDDPTEFPKHFIDIDYYKEFLNGNMIFNRDELTQIYNDSIVTAMGILPWATLETFNNLTNAFIEKNRDRILIYASDLGHYVADGHQPMHTVLNYDGQLSDQKGIHYRYESEMIKRNMSEIETSIDSVTAVHIGDPEKFVFNYITNANSVSPVLFDADEFAFSASGSRGNDDYYRLLWFRTNYITKVQFNNAIESLSSLIYTAWVNAGRPSLAEIN